MDSGVSNETLDFVAQHIGAIIVRATIDGRVTFISSTIRMLGYEPEEFLGEFRTDHIHPDDLPRFLANTRQLKTGEPAPAEARVYRQRTKTGEWRWIEGNPGVVRNDAGEAVELINIYRDVSRRMALEAQAQEQAQLFEAAFDRAAVGKALVGMDGRYLRANRVFCDLLGYSEAELRRLAVPEVTHPDDQENGEAMRELLKGDRDVFAREKRYVRKDGEVVWARLQTTAVRNPKGETEHFLATVLDVGDRLASERALQESEARYRLIAENTSDMIALSDLEGVCTYVSPGVRNLGYAPEDFIGKRIEAFIPSADVPVLLRSRQRLLEGAPVGAPRWRGVHGQTGAPMWLESRQTLLRDPETGAPSQILDVVRDITHQVEQEEALAAARAEAEAAVAVKTQFLANMSHEIRTPLTAVLGFAELLGKRTTLDERARAYIERIAGAGDALLAIVNDILDFSKLEAGKFEIRPRATDLIELCGQTLQLFGTQAEGKGLRLSLDVDVGLPRQVMADSDRVRQVLINLLGNAVKFTESGSVTLRARRDADRGVVLEVEDTGPGLEPEQVSRLFQRFSQVDGSLTRRHGGTGLGLAICKGVTEAMGGVIEVESTPGALTRFRVRLPLSTVAPPEAAEPPPELPSLAGLRVLVVDDHAANRELAGRILETREAIVLEAVGGAEALEVLAQEVVDAVLLDLRMPSVDGREVLRRLRSEPGPNQTAPVIAFTADAEVTLTDPARFDGLVRKPISPAEMVLAVTRAVSATAA
jgi:PAS domain S-box-containing protein